MAKTPVSVLQELMAMQHKPLPIYKEEGFGTDFKCTVLVDGISAIGEGSSKKTAKHECAKTALLTLRAKKPSIPIPSVPKVPNIPMSTTHNFIGNLNELSSKNGWGYPVYTVGLASINGQFSYECSFLNQTSIGCGFNKKEAKQESAKAMWEIVQKLDKRKLKEHQQLPTKTIQHQTISDEESNRVLEVLKKLSMNKQDESLIVANRNTSFDVESEPEIEVEGDAADLKEQLAKYNVAYTLKIMQTRPIIASLRIDNTNTTFISVGNTRNEAIEDVLKQAVKVKKNGLSLDANLSSFTATNRT